MGGEDRGRGRKGEGMEGREQRDREGEGGEGERASPTHYFRLKSCTDSRGSDAESGI